MGILSKKHSPTYDDILSLKKNEQKKQPLL